LSKKINVSYHMSKESKEELDKMAKEITHTEQGRSVTLSLIISFAKKNYSEFKAWCKDELNG